MPGPNIDIGEFVRGLQDRMSFLTHADEHAEEVMQILRDTHRILQKLERTVDRFEAQAREWEEKMAGLDVSPRRVERLEEAVLNIERATLSVEGALRALPRSVQQRILRERKPPPPPG